MCQNAIIEHPQGFGGALMLFIVIVVGFVCVVLLGFFYFYMYTRICEAMKMYEKLISKQT